MSTTTEFIRQTQREAEHLGFKLELPEYFDRLDPQSQNVIAGNLYRELEQIRRSQFIENVSKRTVYGDIDGLCKGPFNKQVRISRPLRTHRYTVDELIAQGIVGLYNCGDEV